MSELKTRTAYSIAMEEEDLESSGTTLVYLKSEADEVIAELKRENAELKDEIKRLENVRKVHIESIESMCEGLKLNAKQICKLKRALYIAHEYKARFKRWWLHLALDCEASEIRPDTKTINRISRKIENCEKSERKCRAKAEEYK